MPAATLTEKGQIVIPAEIRELYQLTPGTQVEFVDEGGTIRLVVRRRVARSDPAAGYGMIKVRREARAQGRAPAVGLRPRGARRVTPEEGMIALDTNVLARFYCDDPDDPEATRQRPIARRVVLESPALLRAADGRARARVGHAGLLRLEPASFCDAVEHLLGMPHVTVERWEAVKDAVDLHRRGLDFADALHWACSRALRAVRELRRSGWCGARAGSAWRPRSSSRDRTRSA